MDSGFQSITISAPKKQGKNGAIYRNPFDGEDEVQVSYETVWNDLQKKFKAIHENLSKKFVSDIATYVKSYKFTGQSIPALALLTGVNVADHESLFKFIKNEVKSVTKHPVVFIRSCHDTSVKPVIERLVQSFLASDSGEPENSDETELDDSGDDEDALKKIKKRKCTLTRLHHWYENRKVNEECYSPLILVISDVESFGRKVLSDFFSSLSVYKDRLPFIMLLGIASDLNALHQRVPLSVLRSYEIVIFKTRPAIEFLDQVLEKIFLTTDCPFQLYGEILDQLIENFTFYNFSVEYFVRGIQFCLINHFLNAEFNTLCCPVDKIEQVVKSLEAKHLSGLLLLSSVGQLNTQRKQDKVPILTEKNIKTELVSFMKELNQRLTRFHVAIRCFYIIVKSIPGDPFDKKLRNIYCEAMKTSIAKSLLFKQCMTHFKLLSSESVLENIIDMERLLSRFEDDPIVAEKLEKIVEFHIAIANQNDEVDNKFRSPGKRKLNSIMMNSSSPKKNPKDQSILQESSFELKLEICDNEQSINSNGINSLSIQEDSQEMLSLKEESCLDDDEPNEPNFRSSFQKSFSEEEPTTPEKVLSTSNTRSSCRKLFDGSTTPIKNLNERERNSPQKLSNGLKSPAKNMTQVRSIPYTSYNLLNEMNTRTKIHNNDKLESSNKEVTQMNPPQVRSSPRKLLFTSDQSSNELNTPSSIQNGNGLMSSMEKLTLQTSPQVRSSPRKLLFTSDQSSTELNTSSSIQNSNGLASPAKALTEVSSPQMQSSPRKRPYASAQSQNELNPPINIENNNEQMSTMKKLALQPSPKVRSSARKSSQKSTQSLNEFNTPVNIQDSNGLPSPAKELIQKSPPQMQSSPCKRPYMSAQSQNQLNNPTNIQDSNELMSFMKELNLEPRKLRQRSTQSQNELNTPTYIRNSHGLMSSMEKLALETPPQVRSSPRKLPQKSPQSQNETPGSSRSAWKERLLKTAAQTKPMSACDQQKYDFVEFLSSCFFGELLECPTMYPFHEVLLYKDAEYVKKHYTSVNQRHEIEKALNNPHNYLKCKCCKMNTPDDFPESMPDLCISYRLYLEYVKDENIDLKAWLSSFESIVSGSEEGTITVDVYNRFKQTIKELQFMGFIEPHRTKADFVRNVSVVRNMKDRLSKLR